MNTDLASTEAAEVRRIKAVRVLALRIDSSMTKEEACARIGISVPTYDRIIAENSDLVVQFKIDLNGPLQELYEDIVKSQTVLVETLIKKAANPEISVKDAIAILKTLEPIQAKLTEELALLSQREPGPVLPQPETSNSSTAEAFLAKQNTSPVLRRGKGVYEKKTTETVETLTVDMNETPVEPPADAIEGEVNLDTES